MSDGGGLEKMKASEKNLDKIRGALIGGAIGDALGYPVEFMTLDRITGKYGELGITAYELDRASGKARAYARHWCCAARLRGDGLSGLADNAVCELPDWFTDEAV